MMDFTFAQPHWAWLLAILPLWWWLNRRFGGVSVPEILKKGRFGHFRHPFFHTFSGAKKSTFKISGGPPFWLRYGLPVLIALMGIVALMEPGREQIVKQVKTVHARHHLVFVVESSVTMTLQDYQADGRPISRMQAVSGALESLMKRLDQGRYGLVLYGEQAATWLPPTADRQLFVETLQRLKPYLLGRTDEGVGAALGLALRNSPLDAVVLITDGINQPSTISLLDVVALAQSRKVLIFTVGVGTGKGRERKTAGLIFQPLDAAALKKLAELTGGRFFAINDGAGLNAALHAIEQDTGSRWTQVQQIKQWHSFTPLWIRLLLGLMALYGVLLWWWLRREVKHAAA